MKVLFVIILIAGAFIGGCFYQGCNKPLSNFDIIPVGHTEYKYIKIPQSCDEYKDCYNSHIEIIAKMTRQNIFSVWAGDACKSSGQEFEIKQQYKKHLVQVQPLVAIGYDKIAQKIQTGYGGQLFYYHSFGLLGIGAGPGFIKLGNSYNFLLAAGLQLQF